MVSVSTSHFRLPKVAAFIKENGGGTVVPFSVEFEQALWEKRADPTAQEEWLKEIGAVSSLPKIVKTGFKEL